MRRNFTKIGAIALSVMLAAGIATSCGDDKKPEQKNAKTKTEKRTDNLPNYRYVVMDSVLSQYNLAKDYNEEMLRMQNSAESEMKQHQNQLQNFAQTVQNKMQNNGYLSEESYKADEQKMAQMQANAQKASDNLQAKLMQAQINSQKALEDSIVSYIEIYNKTHGYDAIFWKSATLYINPDLDITDEVIEGLNARYNKVKK